MTVEPSDDEDIRVTHAPETDTYRATFDSATVEPTVTVVQAMATAEGTDHTDLEPLYETVDPEALDRICSDSSPPRRDGNRTVGFTYLGRRVTVESLGFVEISPIDDER